MNRVPQPPINPAVRSSEIHDFWTGLAVGIAALLLLICGALHSTNVDTVGGGTASEVQLMNAFASGGMQYASQVKPPPPPVIDGSQNPEAVIERWNKQVAEFKPPAWKVRVDLDAKTPCPT